MMDMKALEDLENAQVYINCEALNDGVSSITINTDGINLIGATPTPYEPYPIKFPNLGELDLYKHHEGCDFGCDGIDALRYAVEDMNKKEGKDMKLLNMYVEKSEKNIKDYYEKLLDEEYNSREVMKEFKTLCDKFQEDLAKLAEKTANDECKLVELDWEDFEPAYGIECNPTEEEDMLRDKLNEELKQLHEKVEEVQAQLEIVTSDENSSHHDINYVLYNYGIVDDANKLTPYTPTFVGKEAPKKAGRPKKVSE